MRSGRRSSNRDRSWLIGLASLVGLAVTVACAPGCSGATPQESLESQPTSGASSGATSGGTSGATSGGTSGNTSGGTSGATVDGGTTCPPEVEPNDSPDTANVLAPTRCGSIQPNSESDFLTFQLKQSTTSMQIKFDGKVTLRIDVGNQSVTLGNGNAPKVPFQKNAKYVIEIKATDRANSVPWRVDLIEQ